MNKTLVLYAHPYPGKSRATQRLLQVLQEQADFEIHSLYERYPDFDIDVQAEQQALQAAQNLVWLSPVYWYGVPALLKHWMDMVLEYGWAYGPGGTVLQGKRCWWIASAGAEQAQYSSQGSHRRPFAEYLAPIEGSALYCGMEWLPPFVVHAFGQADSARQDEICKQLQQTCRTYFQFE